MKKSPIEVTMETIKNKAVDYEHKIFNDKIVRKYFFINRATLATSQGFYKRVPDLLIHEYQDNRHQRAERKYDIPEMPLPRDIKSGFSEFWKSRDVKSEPRPTVVLVLFGISIPTRDFPGIGASIRIG